MRYLWIHVIENTEEPTLAGIGWNVTKEISSLYFTVPKSIWKLQGNLERGWERDGIKAFHTTKLITGYSIWCSSNSFSLFHSTRGTQFCERVSTENIWACSPRGTGKEKKPTSLTNCKCTDGIRFTMEFTMENAQEIQQNFYKPNVELSDPILCGEFLNPAFKCQHCYNPVSGIMAVTVLF